jgi:hypothetical protein
MRVLERQPERRGATRHKHQVDVVRHEAVPHHRHGVQRKTLLQQIKIDAAICIPVGRDGGTAYLLQQFRVIRGE